MRAHITQTGHTKSGLDHATWETLRTFVSRPATSLPYPLADQALQFLTQLSSDLLHAELSRRQDNGDRPECGSGHKTRGYNTGLHVFALFLILGLSTFACSFPLIVRQWTPRLVGCHADGVLLGPTFPQPTRSQPLPLHLSTLWHRRPDRNSLCTPSSNRFC